jgi:hypothetical protein
MAGGQAGPRTRSTDSAAVVRTPSTPMPRPTEAGQAIDASPSIGDDYGMSDYTYDELVGFHEQMTRRLRRLTAEGLIEFHVSRPRGIVEVLVSHPYDQGDLDALVAGIPRGAYEVLTTADAGEDAAVSPSSTRRRLLGRFDRIIRRIARRRES